ncbi:EH signature domain-containing protein [Ideonella margarita]|uniref:EH signature domain-containing protein n=1 Tax=Ideonella margarita TaxID=2984191 RepID=A0ABU9CBP7_9BURK
MFAPLPTGFQFLQHAAERLGAVELVAPKQMEEIGLRMRKVYERARETGYKHLSKGALRRLPYAIWVDGQPSLDKIEPQLMQLYWDKVLPEALSQPRSSKRWLNPLFYVYCHWFKRLQPGFLLFAQSLNKALSVAKGSMADLLIDLNSRYAWFDPRVVGSRLGAVIVKSTKPIPDVLSSLHLWSGFLDEPIASDAFEGALGSSMVDLTDEAQIAKVLIWSRNDVGGENGAGVARYPEHRVLLAEALVRPWFQRRPPEALKTRLLSYFMRHYGDPRHIGNVNKGHNWQGVSPQVIATLKAWLVGDTLRGFMRILQLTADDIWMYRERFWTAYYDKGVIEEAWVALGSQAAWMARREFAKGDWNQFGALTAGATSDQSVLFLRIGDIVFTEWSHSGSLRATRAGDPQTPRMYLREYSGHDLRSLNSMDFHEGGTQLPQLTHANSAGGTWQRRARDFIAKHTGVRLNDQAIIG